MGLIERYLGRNRKTEYSGTLTWREVRRLEKIVLGKIRENDRRNEVVEALTNLASRNGYDKNL